MIQFLIDGLVNGSIIALGAVGLSITYNVLRFANFAQGEVLAVGAYVSLALVSLMGVGIGRLGPISLGWPLLGSMVFSMLVTCLLVLGVDWVLFRILRQKQASRITFIIAAFGVSMMVRNVITLIAGGDQLFYSFYIPKAIKIMEGVKILPDDLLILFITLISVISLHVFLNRSTMGKKMRAVAENPALAMVSGINVERVFKWSWILGASLAAVAGTLHAHITQLDPEMGFELILPMFAALIVGGVTNVYGAVLGGLLIGLSESFAVAGGGAAYRGAISFMILILVLVFRPQGILGEKERDD
ncbi:MAG: branched-chain amino acid ABC transporter permease [SAR324 cluster bacterium]|jgi:branched-chain amino acid transport system permease protein|nr:branched-chain amino acid ABC transporter permease [SAR324 cluster bacterium]|tara:strand:- start:510 stop:1415 length:906 start_codon:yes stop_codon:yes gene_type:complete